MANIDGSPTVIEQIRSVLVGYQGTVGKAVSLADVAKVARVEPITLISSNLTGVSELYQILHGVLNVYAGFYLQAVQVLSAELSDARILKILDRTNPDRDLKTLLATGGTAYESYAENVKTLSLEGVQYKLPEITPRKTAISAALEAVYHGAQDADDTLGTAVVRLDTFEKLGVGVGKVVQVSFRTPGPDGNGIETSMVVGVKLDTMVIPAEAVRPIMTANNSDIKIGPRLRDAITGRIHPIKDFLMCSDLIKAQKKAMIKDPTGYYAQIVKRVNSSRFFSALSGNVSLAGVSAILVISEEDEREVQKQIGGKLTNTTTRNIVFDNMSVMMICVVDREWERVSIYIRDMDSFSQDSFSAFKGTTDKNSDSIADIVKALGASQAPAF